MNPYQKLGGQALIYGMGNIVPRVLNYAVLTVYYTRRFEPEAYGVITELYAYVAILLVILTYGMETGLFKFSNDRYQRETVYRNTLSAIITTSLIFAVLVIFFRNDISKAIGYSGNSEYIIWLGLTLSLDAIGSVVFAKLRIENKIRRFAIVKIVNVLVTVFFVFLFLEILPVVKKIADTEIYVRYLKDIEVGYVFIANLLASLVVLLLLIKDLKPFVIRFDRALLKKMLMYSFPLLIAGLAGIFNETIDRILLRKLTPENLNPLYQIGIYGANYRIAVLMTIFVQMFRYAAEPFFFNYANKNNWKEIYGNVLTYFTIFMMLIFLGVGLGMDIFKRFIDVKYYEGLKIVPIVLMANVFVGMLFNVNMWYKLSGQTIYGVYITGFGALITIVLNILLIPRYGYIACAWIHLIANFVMVVITYLAGQRFYPITYNIRRISLYMALGIGIYLIGIQLQGSITWINILICVVFTFVYFIFCNHQEGLIKLFLQRHENKNR